MKLFLTINETIFDSTFISDATEVAGSDSSENRLLTLLILAVLIFLFIFLRKKGVIG